MKLHINVLAENVWWDFCKFKNNCMLNVGAITCARPVDVDLHVLLLLSRRHFRCVFFPPFRPTILKPNLNKQRATYQEIGLKPNLNKKKTKTGHLKNILLLMKMSNEERKSGFI